MPTPSLEAALDRLYDGAPADFVARRSALAAELRSAGATADAAAITARKKPTQVAYVLNQLARRHPADIEALVDLGRTLDRAQRAARRGEAGDLRAALAEQRQLLAVLAKRSASVGKELGVTLTPHEPLAAFHAALADPAVGAALEAGTLSTAPTTGEGFLGLASAPSEREVERNDGGRTERALRRGVAANEAPKSPVRSDARAEARARALATKAERERHEAEREERRSQAREAKARARAEALATKLDHEASVAEREAHELERVATQATKKAEAARVRATALRARVGAQTRT